MSLWEFQGQGLRALLDQVTICEGIDLTVLATVEKQRNVVFPGHVQRVVYQHLPRQLIEHDPTPVHDWARQAHIAVMPAFETIRLRRSRPETASPARLP